MVSSSAPATGRAAKQATKATPAHRRRILQLAMRKDNKRRIVAYNVADMVESPRIKSRVCGLQDLLHSMHSGLTSLSDTKIDGRSS